MTIQTALPICLRTALACTAVAFAACSKASGPAEEPARPMPISVNGTLNTETAADPGATPAPGRSYTILSWFGATSWPDLPDWLGQAHESNGRIAFDNTEYFPFGSREKDPYPYAGISPGVTRLEQDPLGKYLRATYAQQDGTLDPVGIVAYKNETIGGSALRGIDCTFGHLCSKLVFKVKAGDSGPKGTKVYEIKVSNVRLPQGIALVRQPGGPKIEHIVAPIRELKLDDKTTIDLTPTCNSDQEVKVVRKEGITATSDPTVFGEVIVAPMIVGADGKVGDGTRIGLTVTSSIGVHREVMLPLSNTGVPQGTIDCLKGMSWSQMRAQNPSSGDYKPENDHDLIPGVAYEITISIHGSQISLSAKTASGWNTAGQSTVVIS